MASISRSSSASRHSRVCRRLRVTLIRELPEPQALLEHPELKGKFSDHDRSKILSPLVLCGKTEELVNTLEWSSRELFQSFLAALKQLKPSLAARLEEEMAREGELGSAANGAVGSGSSQGCSASGAVPNVNAMRRERLVMPVQEVGDRQPQANRRVEEDAGVFGLNGYGPGPAHLISHLSYNGRQYLASKLNGTPPTRNTFHSFCHALGVENKLIQASSRSANPTGYLLQTYSSRPEATMERLRQALTDIEMGNVYERLTGMMGEDGGPEDN